MASTLPPLVAADVRRLWSLPVLLAAALCNLPPAAAHDSPEHVVEALTIRIHAQPKRPDLFWRRATEYRALGRLDAAARDLRQAIKLDPAFLPALADLGRVQLAQGSRGAARRTIEQALSRATDEAARAPLRMVLAEVLIQTGDFPKALAQCQAAISGATAPTAKAGATNGSGAELDWYLTRGQIQSRLGLFGQAAAGLREGYEQTGSAVLEVEYIEALIDGGFFTEASAQIEPLLNDCRWRSSWLIRRARCRLGQGETSAAHQDLLAAISELNQRLGAPHPSPELLADRSLAYALAGDMGLARRDLSHASQLGVEETSLRRVRLILAKGL
ncbi:MAG TPA: tetratricopeptide repeat protein [Verrucomicrobiae bacterium]|jgi:tetratricopeptide (TPR) repeat protein|nr:tetratricopeptide repeat protein [Verrucomicrobiae bacterium]